MKIHALTLIACIFSLLSASPLSAQFASPIRIDSATHLITNIVTADINNDQLNDLIVTQKFSANSLIAYYLNQGNFSFGPETTIAAGNSQVTNIAVGDFNNDNWLDIVSIGDANNEVTLYINNALSFTPQVLDSFLFFESDVAALDVNNDNQLDIVAVGGTTFKVFKNNGSGNFTTETISGPIEDFFDITAADIDADGFTDVITGGSNISVYKNTNGNLQYDSARSSQIPSSNNLFLRLVDLDNDGDADLFSEDNNSSGARWMENDGNGNFSNLQIIDADATFIRSGGLVDVDNDSDIDLLLLKDFNVHFYANDGQGNFSTSTLVYDAPTTISTLHASDFNNDGLKDLVWSSDLSVQQNILVTSTAEHAPKQHKIKIYPNPSNGEQLMLVSSQEATVTISNLQGQIVCPTIQVFKGQNQLPLHSLPPQIYLLQVELPTEIVTQKIVVR